jgi:hypothetical protein
MTHDGMWFYHCVQEFGIEAANKINKAAIKSLAPIEVRRVKEALGMKKEKIETFGEFKYFFAGISELFVAEFMNITMTFPEQNVLHWEFEPKKCFAYKGMKHIGVIDKYECGVIYRVACWIDSLGVEYSVNPRITGCLMLASGTCSGDFSLYFE